ARAAAAEARGARDRRHRRRRPRRPDVAGARAPRVREAVRCGGDGEDRVRMERRLARLEAPAGAVVAGPSFARGLWRIAAADVSSHNRVTLLRDGEATFGAMLEAIAAATHAVCLEGYIFRDDEVGQRFAAALGEAS